MKLSRAIGEYLDYQRAQLKQSSYETLERTLRLHVEPFFRCDSLPLKPSRLIDFKAKLAAEAISPQYRRSIYTTLACAMNFAYRLYDIENTTKRVPNFKRPPRIPRPTYDQSMYNVFRSGLKSRLYETFFDVLFYGGLRRGEALALTPADLEGLEISITKTYSMRRLTSPKTYASIRRLRLPPEVMEELYKMAKGRPQEARLFDKTSYSSIKRKLDKTAKAAGLPIIRVHDFRHSNITNLLYYGFTPQGIAKRVGHSNIETLLNNYAETNRQEDAAIAAKLEQEINRSKETETVYIPKNAKDA